MTGFQPKKYQIELLDSVRAYFEACHEFGNPATAFTVVTERLWQQLSAYLALGAAFDVPDGTALVVEVKGRQGWTDAADDRAIGGLWAELSGGRCRFSMVRDRQWQAIDALLAAA